MPFFYHEMAFLLDECQFFSCDNTQELTQDDADTLNKSPKMEKSFIKISKEYSIISKSILTIHL